MPEHAQVHTHAVRHDGEGKSGAIAFVYSKERTPSLTVIPACEGLRV